MQIYNIIVWKNFGVDFTVKCDCGDKTILIGRPKSGSTSYVCRRCKIENRLDYDFISGGCCDPT